VTRRDLHLPADGVVRAAAVVLHPHPSMGGNRHHPLVVSLSEGLAAKGIAALRPDIIDPNPAVAAEELDRMATGWLAEVGAVELVLAGYSWGSVVTTLASVPAAKRVLVAPPVSSLALGAPTGSPTLVLVPAGDQYGPPDAVREAIGGWPATTIEAVEGTDHFLAGAMSRIATRAVEWLADGVP